MIGQAIVLYSNNNQGQYPPDLGTLLTTQELDPQVFLCPERNKHLPGNFAQMSNEEKRLI